jgi:hypothetical protein
MRKTAVCLLAFAALCWANPFVVEFFSEVQTAPDSLEFLEIHPYNWPYYPMDLGGCMIVSGADTARVDSGVVLWDETDYVVLDHSNTHGNLRLPDDSGSVTLFSPCGDTVWTLFYPDGPYQYSSDVVWSPPEGMSCAIYQGWTPWPDPYDYYVWYVDSTPTPGAPNDDTLGGISGRVLDQNSQPLNEAWVTLSFPRGHAHVYTSTDGTFEFRPLGPGTYWLTAQKTGYLSGCYPESVCIGANEHRGGINILLYPAGIVERTQPVRVMNFTLARRNRTLMVEAGRAVTAEFDVVDNSGRRRLRESLRLAPGRNAVPLTGLPPGGYIVRCRAGNELVSGKVIIY